VHIGLCSPQWPPSGAANGIVSYVSAVRGHLVAQGHAVSVISDGRLFGSDGLDRPLLPEPREPSWFARAARKTDRWHGGLPEVGRMVAAQVLAARRIAEIDIVEMEESFGWCGIVQRRTGIPVVTRLHGPHVLKPPRQRTLAERFVDSRRCAAEARALRSISSLTAPTHATMDATRNRYGIAPDPLHRIIPNPISLPPEAQRWSLADCDRNHILMVGRFDFWKGADTMLTAFARLLALRPEARLTVVGPDTGLETAPGRVTHFEDYVRANLPPEARARIDFTGILPPARIAVLRRQAYVTVVASRWENFPYVLLEGLGAASPMVSTDWAGSDEIIADGTSGLLTPLGEPEPLAQRIDWLMANPDQACRIAAEGHRRCRERFSVEAVGAELLRHYEATLERAKPQ